MTTLARADLVGEYHRGDDMTAVGRFVAKAGAFVVDACLYAFVRWMWRLRVAEKAQRRTENEGTR